MGVSFRAMMDGRVDTYVFDIPLARRPAFQVHLLEGAFHTEGVVGFIGGIGPMDAVKEQTAQVKATQKQHISPMNAMRKSRRAS